MSKKANKKTKPPIIYIDYTEGCAPEKLLVYTKPEEEYPDTLEVTKISSEYCDMSTDEAHSDKLFTFQFKRRDNKLITLSWAEADTIATYMNIFKAESPLWNDTEGSFLAKKVK